MQMLTPTSGGSARASSGTSRRYAEDIGLQRAVVSRESPITTDIHWLSSAFLSQTLNLYDHSVWTLRNVVREIEEVRALRKWSAGIDTNASY